MDGAGLGRVYFRSSVAHWSIWESISINRIWAFCWDIATHHINRFSFFTVCGFGSVFFSSTKCVLFFFLLSLGEKNPLNLFFFPSLSEPLRAACLILSEKRNWCSEQPRICQTPKLLKGDQSRSFLHLWPIPTSWTRFLHVCFRHLTFSWQTWIYETRAASTMLCFMVLWSFLQLSVRKSLKPDEVLKLFHSDSWNFILSSFHLKG